MVSQSQDGQRKRVATDGTMLLCVIQQRDLAGEAPVSSCSLACPSCLRLSWTAGQGRRAVRRVEGGGGRALYQCMEVEG